MKVKPKKIYIIMPSRNIVIKCLICIDIINDVVYNLNKNQTNTIDKLEKYLRTMLLQNIKRFPKSDIMLKI